MEQGDALSQELRIVLKFLNRYPHLKLEATPRRRNLYHFIQMKEMRLKEFKLYTESKKL